jgi:ABC-type amino acid transport substrate-binding protein
LKIVFPNTTHVTGRPYYSAIIVAVRDSAWIAARVRIDANGGDSSTVKFVELPFSAVLAALEAGRIDAGVTAKPFLGQAIKSGRGRSVGDLQAGFGPDHPDDVFRHGRVHREKP